MDDKLTPWDVVQMMASGMRGDVALEWQADMPCDNPPGIKPCRYCGGMCMSTESLERDWFGRGRVIRITAMCDEIDRAMEGSDGDEYMFAKDACRTEYAPEADAVAAWNERFGVTEIGMQTGVGG